MNAGDVELAAQNLSVLSEHQLISLAALKIGKRQEDLGGSFQGSVKEWQDTKSHHILGLCFSQHRNPVGMVLLKRPPLSPEWTPPSAVSLHGLKIAQAHQGVGFGRRAFELSVAHAKRTWPNATSLILAVDAGNDAALAVYRGFGMSDSGPIFQGRIGWEHRLDVPL